MKNVIFAFGLLISSAMAYGQYSAYTNVCTSGARNSTTSGLNSTNLLLSSYTYCLVTVYQSGTTNLATIYSSATGGVQSNPFYASAITGQFLFWGTTGAVIDVTMSGGYPAPGIPSPFTWTGITLGGGGGGGGIPYPPNTGVPQVVSGAAWGTTLTVLGTGPNVPTATTLSGTNAAVCWNNALTTSGCPSPPSGTGTLNLYALWTGTNTLGTGHLDDGVSNAGYNTSTEGLVVQGSATAPNIVLPEVTPTSPTGPCAVNLLNFWQDSAADYAKFCSNNIASLFLMGADSAATGAGYFWKAGANNYDATSSVAYEGHNFNETGLQMPELMQFAPEGTATSSLYYSSYPIFFESSAWNAGITLTVTNAGTGYTYPAIGNCVISGGTATREPTCAAISNSSGNLSVSIVDPGVVSSTSGMTISTGLSTSGTAWAGTLALAGPAAQDEPWVVQAGFSAPSGGVQNTMFDINCPESLAVSGICQLAFLSKPQQGIQYGWLFNADAPGYTMTLSESALSANTQWILPAANVSGYLSNNGSGTLSWASPPSGTSVEVNGGSGLTTANFNGTTPAAQSSYINVTWQTSTTNVSAEVPIATTSVFGLVKPDGTIITDTSGAITVAKASSSAFGVVEVDNTTITASAGVISAVSQGIADIQITLTTSAISANSCESGGYHTATMTGLASTSAVSFSPSTDVTSVTGWSPGTGGLLYISSYPTTNTLNYVVCNPTGSSITPGSAIVVNVSAR